MKGACFLLLILLTFHCVAATAQSKRPIVLQGRIEQIVGGVSLPVKLRALTGKFDLSIAGSYPVDWRGTWGGTLKVHSAQFAPSSYADAAEGQQEQRLIKTGADGQVNFQFS